MSLVQVVDIGTTNIKSGIVNEKGEVVAQKNKQLEVKHPETGAAIHDPEQLYEDFCGVTKGTNEGYKPDIDYLVLSGYLFGFLPLDHEKEPLTGMITLLDERPKRIMGEIESHYPVEELYRRTGCPPLFIYSFAKILWLREEKPEIYGQTAYMADLKSFLINKLAGEFITEVSTASATQLYNVHEGGWDEKVLDWLNLSRDYLPNLSEGYETVASLSGKTADSLGLKEGTCLIPGLYDGGAMMLGMGGYEGDDAICNMGTTAMLRKCSPNPVLDEPDSRRLQTYKLLPNRWVTGGSLNNAGIALKWFRDNFAPQESYENVVEAAEEIEPGCDGLVFLPFLTGERDPRMGNFSSGLFFGLKTHHTKAHLGRAVMEGVVYALGLVFQAIGERKVNIDKVVIGGSGSQGRLWPQLVADILKVPVEKSTTKDATLIGGAMLAYKNGGVYSDLSKASDGMVKKGRIFSPQKRHFDRYRKVQAFFEKLVKRMKPLFQEHTRLLLKD